MERRVTIITGASGGIGADLARVMARNGHELVLVARSEALMQALADEIAKTAKRPLVVVLDLGGAGVADKLLERLREEQMSVEILVNNAGFGLFGDVAKLDRTEQIAMIDLNVRALTDLTAAFLPDITKTKGHILNVASIAAFMPGPGMAVYYATKAFVLSFSDALGHELRGSGVKVTALCPGPVATGFQARAGLRVNLRDIYNLVPSLLVAEQGYAGMKRGTRVVVPGILNRLVVWFILLTPKALVLRIIGRLQAGRNPDRGQETRV